MKTYTIILILFCLSLLAQAQTRIIFDTDFGGDADDLGALAMLNHFHNQQEAELLGIMCWSTEKHSVAAMDAVNTFYGNPDIPLGRRAGELQETDWNHGKVLAENLNYELSELQTFEATALYRKLLATQPDQSVTIVTVGPLLNIKRLLNSAADEYSALNGTQLIEAKVKEFVIMGGQFPSGEKEWNFDGNMKGVTRLVLEQLTVPITFLGYEIGQPLKTGEVFNELPKDSPLYLGFYHFSKYCPWLNEQFEGKIYDNSTYDQTAVLYAVRGLGSYWHRVSNGFCQADDNGGNTWVSKKESNHSYLVLDWPLEKMAAEIESFMLGEF